MKKNYLSLKQFGLVILLLLMYSCGNELQITMPQGPEGPEGRPGLSAYETWKVAVGNGTLEWDASQTEIVDFFLYLKGEKGDKGENGENGKDGVDGKSAYELWVEMAKDGDLIDADGNIWPADKTTVYDFWEYLSGADGKNGLTPEIGTNGNWWIGGEDTGVKAKGEDGVDGIDGVDGESSVLTIVKGTWHINDVDTGIPATGRSAYELWVIEVGSADGLKNPHADDESNWPTGETSLADFWRYLRGRDGSDCECSTGSEIPRIDYIQPMSKATPATTLAQDVPSGWIKKTSYAAYEGFVFLPTEAVATQNPKLVEQITIPFWRQRIEFAFSCEGSDIEVVLVGGNDDLTGSWVDVSRSDVDFEHSETGGIYTRKFRISFEANDMPDEQFRELTLRFRTVDDVTTYKEIKIRQIYLPNMLSRYSKASVAELNTFGTEITEDNFATLTGDDCFHYQWGRNMPIQQSKAYTSTGKAIFWEDTNISGTLHTANYSDLWDPGKIIGLTNVQTFYNDQAAGDTWVSKIVKAQTNGAPTNYVGANGGDPCPVGWHLPTRAEIYSFAIGHKGSSHDYYRFNYPYTNDNTFETTGSYDSGSGIRWDYWTRGNGSGRAYASIHGTGTGGGSSNSPQVAAFPNFEPIYAVKFMSKTVGGATYDVYEVALKGAFKYEIIDNSGNYYCKVTYRHLGENSPIVSASEIQGSFWTTNTENDITAILPLYGIGAAGVSSNYNNATGYYSTSEIRRISSTPSPTYLFIGGPNDTGKTGGRQTFSGEWSFGGISGTLRCIKNPQDPELPATAGSFPTWN